MKRLFIVATVTAFFSQFAYAAIQCLPEFDDDYHDSDTVTMCRDITNFYIGGLTDQLKQPVRDKLIVENVSPANAIAYVSITPYQPLIMDGQMSTFTIPVMQGQCLDLISTFGHYPSPAAFSLKLVSGENNADNADFNYEVGSDC